MSHDAERQPPQVCAPHLGLDESSERFQLNRAECLEGCDGGFQPQLFRREPIDLLAVPTKFARTGKDRPVKIVLVGDGVATAQMRTVDGPMLPEKAKGFLIPAARNQKVGGNLKPALEHSMHGRKIGLSFVTGEPVGKFAGHLADALALLNGEVTLIRSDRISTDDSFRSD